MLFKPFALAISLALTTPVAISTPVVANPSPSPSTPTVPFDDLYLRYSQELGITGCSQVGDPLPLLCLGWMEEGLMTCLQWGDSMAIAACVRQGQGTPRRPLELHQGTDVLPMPSPQGWGYRLNLYLP